MRYEDWEPLYLKIVNEFGYSIAEDSRSASLLSGLLSEDQKVADVDSFMRNAIQSKKFIILGPCQMDPYGPGILKGKLESLGASLVTVGEGTKNALESGLPPYMIFTDLDGFPDLEIEANGKGTIAVVHAHGDNMARLKTWVPRFQGKVIPTCQCAPVPGVHNWGGFTDGDRAYCALRHFGASDVMLESFDFTKPCGSKHVDPETKKRKLEWAERIISNSRV